MIIENPQKHTKILRGTKESIQEEFDGCAFKLTVKIVKDSRDGFHTFFSFCHIYNNFR